MLKQMSNEQIEYLLRMIRWLKSQIRYISRNDIQLAVIRYFTKAYIDCYKDPAMIAIRKILDPRPGLKTYFYRLPQAIRGTIEELSSRGQ